MNYKNIIKGAGLTLLIAGMALPALAKSSFLADNQGEQGQENNNGSNVNSSEDMSAGGLVHAVENKIQNFSDFTSSDVNDNEVEKEAAPMTLAINPDGHIRITDANVTSVGSNSFAVSIWGLNFTVNIVSDTQFSNDESLSAMKVGDTVDLVGMLTGAGSPGVLTADVVHDRSLAVQANQDKMNSLRVLINNLIAKLEAILAQQGESLPPGLSPLPVTPVPTPSPSPVVTPTPSPVATPTPTPSPAVTPTPTPS